jgi:two-component sensor histidine kinase
MTTATLRNRIIFPVILIIVVVMLLLCATVLLVTKKVSEDYQALILQSHSERVQGILANAVSDLVDADLLGKGEVVAAKQRATLDELAAYWKEHGLEGSVEGKEGVLSDTPRFAGFRALVPQGGAAGHFHRYQGFAFISGIVTPFPAWEWRVITVPPPVNLFSHNTAVFYLIPAVLLSGALLFLGVLLFLRMNLERPVEEMMGQIARGVPVAPAGLAEIDRLGGAVNGAVAALQRRNAELRLLAEEHKRAQENVQASLTEKEVLLKEIHHRVKNNLQVISGLLNLQAMHIEDRSVREIYRESENRILTMSLIHEQLYQSRDLAQVGFADYLHQLVQNLRVSYGMDRRGIHLELTADDAPLVVDTAIPAALIANELVSNAFKHAFPGGIGGTIRIGFSSPAAKSYLLTIEDDGVGFPEGKDYRSSKSMGMQLVTILSQQLGGGVELVRGGKGTLWKVAFREYLEAGTVLY